MPKPKKVPRCPHPPCPGHTYSQGLHRARICDTCGKPDRTLQYADSDVGERLLKYVLFDPSRVSKRSKTWLLKQCFVALVEARSPQEVEQTWPLLKGVPFNGLKTSQQRWVIKLNASKK
jgi:hypothetical protein